MCMSTQKLLTKLGNVLKVTFARTNYNPASKLKINVHLFQGSYDSVL